MSRSKARRLRDALAILKLVCVMVVLMGIIMISPCSGLRTAPSADLTAAARGKPDPQRGAKQTAHHWTKESKTMCKVCETRSWLPAISLRTILQTVLLTAFSLTVTTQGWAIELRKRLHAVLNVVASLALRPWLRLLVLCAGSALAARAFISDINSLQDSRKLANASLPVISLPLADNRSSDLERELTTMVKIVFVREGCIQQHSFLLMRAVTSLLAPSLLLLHAALHWPRSSLFHDAAAWYLVVWARNLCGELEQGAGFRFEVRKEAEESKGGLKRGRMRARLHNATLGVEIAFDFGDGREILDLVPFNLSSYTKSSTNHSEPGSLDSKSFMLDVKERVVDEVPKLKNAVEQLHRHHWHQAKANRAK